MSQMITSKSHFMISFKPSTPLPTAVTARLREVFRGKPAAERAAEIARKLAEKIWHLRVMDDADGVMNLSVADTTREVLIVSQFTLYGDTSAGRRPSWIAAARPEHAEPLVQAVIDHLRTLGATVATGRFRTEMLVSLVNDGPVTVIVDL